MQSEPDQYNAKDAIKKLKITIKPIKASNPASHKYDVDKK